MRLVPAILSPSAARTALPEISISQAPRIYFLLFEVPMPADGVRHCMHSLGRAGRVPSTNQVSSPRLRTTLSSCKYYICIALKKRSHIIQLVGLITKPTRMLRKDQTQETKDSGSASVLVTNGPGPDAGLSSQRQQADGTISHRETFSHLAQIQTGFP